jgi:hypothetical protein
MGAHQRGIIFGHLFSKSVRVDPDRAHGEGLDALWKKGFREGISSIQSNYL